MFYVNTDGHAAYQYSFVSEFLKLYANLIVVPKDKWDIIMKFWYLDFSKMGIILLEYYCSLGKAAKRYSSCLQLPLTTP